jgi:hypothetical protein
LPLFLSCASAAVEVATMKAAANITNEICMRPP